MISTAFPIETDASNKLEPLAKKFASVWEKKNSKAARAGGISLMALTLAACGAEDDTPFSQDDIDAATAPLTAAVTVAQTQAATALVAQAAAETATQAATVQAATAMVAKAAADTQAATALVAQAAAEATAATAVVASATATAAKVTAETALATAQAALVVETAAKVAAQTSQATAEASLVTAQAAQTTAEGLYNALIAPRAAALSTGTDVLQGGEGNDSYTGVAGTVTAGDSVRDSSTIDADTLSVTSTTNLFNDITIQNIESVSFAINNLNPGATTINAVNYSGVDNLTITRGDIVVGGATLSGNKTVAVDNVAGGALGIAKITTAGVTTSVTVTQDISAGVTVDANNATGAFIITGAGTINAAGAGVGDTVTVTAIAVAGPTTAAMEAVANALPLTINTGAALVDINNGGGGELFDGVINVTALAGNVNIANATGGATVTSLGGTTSGATTVTGIDASGATVTTSLNQAASATAQDIDLQAAAASGTTVYTATVSARGNVSLDTGKAANAVDSVTLQGNGGAVNYAVETTAGNTETFTATSDVTLTGNELVFAGETVTGAAAIMLTSASIGGATIDASKWSATKIGVAFNQTGTAAVTAASAQNYEFTTAQTNIDFDFLAGVVDQDITLTAGDINGVADTTVGTLTMGGINATTAGATSGTLSIIANESNLTATSVTIAAKQDITITGDENVTLGTVTNSNAINSEGSTGNLSVTIGNGSKAINSGSGVDTLILNGNTGVHTVSAGAGADIITLTASAATSTIDAGAGDDVITIAETSQIVVIGGDGADTFNAGTNNTATIIGGAGSDTLTITAAIDFVSGFAVSTVEKLNISAVNGNVTFDAAEFAGLASAQITGNSVSDTVLIGAAAGGSTLDMSGLTASTGSVQTIQVNMGAGNDIITGSVLAETFAFNGTTGWKGTDTIAGGATGIDLITTNDSTIQEVVGTGATSSGIVVNLGTTAVSNVAVLQNAVGHLGGTTSAVNAGTIQYMYAAADSTNVNASIADSVSGIENFTSTDAAGIEYVVGNSSANVINVGAGADYVSGGAGNDTIAGEAGADKLVGGDGNDTFVINTTAHGMAGNFFIDTVTGGNGTTDTIGLGSGVTLAAADDFQAKVSGVEILGASGAAAGVISITTHATFASDTGIAIIDLSADTNVIGSNVIDISAQTTTTAMAITGSAGKDTITLDNGSTDTITAGASGLTLLGNTTDAVVNFVSGTDKFDFNLAAGTVANYAEASAAGGASDAIGMAAGLIAANIAMNSTVIYYFYDNTTGAADNGYLYVDSDSNGTADFGVVITGATALTNFGQADIIA